MGKSHSHGWRVGFMAHCCGPVSDRLPASSIALFVRGNITPSIHICTQCVCSYCLWFCLAFVWSGSRVRVRVRARGESTQPWMDRSSLHDVSAPRYQLPCKYCMSHDSDRSFATVTTPMSMLTTTTTTTTTQTQRAKASGHSQNRLDCITHDEPKKEKAPFAAVVSQAGENRMYPYGYLARLSPPLPSPSWYHITRDQSIVVVSLETSFRPPRPVPR